MRRLSDTAQLMALALLNLSDDGGYFLADLFPVRSFARPFDEDSVKTHGALSELSLSGWVKIVDQPTRGRLVVNFEKHGRQDCDHPL